MNRDQFYFLFIKEAFPQVDFEYNEAKSPEEMAQNIDSILEFISSDVLVDFDLSSIKGNQIIDGNIEQIATLLQVLYEISKLIMEKGGSLTNSKKGGSSDINSKSNRSAQEKISPKSQNDHYSLHSQEDSGSKQSLEEHSNKVQMKNSKSDKKKGPKKGNHEEIKGNNNKEILEKLEKGDLINMPQNHGNQKPEEFYTLRDILRNKRIPFTTLSEKRKIIDKYFTNCDSAPSGSNRNSEFEYIKQDSNLINQAESTTNLKWTDIFGSSREDSSQQISGIDKSKTNEENENSLIQKNKDKVIENQSVEEYVSNNNKESNISEANKSKEISNNENQNEQSNSSEIKNKINSVEKVNMEDSSESNNKRSD